MPLGPGRRGRRLGERPSSTFWPKLVAGSTLPVSSVTQHRPQPGFVFTRRRVPPEQVVRSGPIRLTAPIADGDRAGHPGLRRSDRHRAAQPTGHVALPAHGTAGDAAARGKRRPLARAARLACRALVARRAVGAPALPCSRDRRLAEQPRGRAARRRPTSSTSASTGSGSPVRSTDGSTTSQPDVFESDRERQNALLLDRLAHPALHLADADAGSGLRGPHHPPGAGGTTVPLAGCVVRRARPASRTADNRDRR